MKKVFIMRGIPGSGKTTAARALAGKEGIIHSTDEYFEINGIYKFDTTRLQEYHDRNFEAFSMSLKENISIVICDNVNQKYIHYKRYICAAKIYGYTVTIIFLEHLPVEVAFTRTKHKVPLHTIKRMIKEWEY
ncbi:MAG: hypothetical protein A2586_01815 [Candidatus Harrisonbacteria bacterium RIFOXYD1_FULL_40_9]|nr:MAG: hypothetical protein A2586_01815 [Candidatus Harrisonbacteria bacterium RIFOXYD1_FULL_40_9]